LRETDERRPRADEGEHPDHDEGYPEKPVEDLPPRRDERHRHELVDPGDDEDGAGQIADALDAGRVEPEDDDAEDRPQDPGDQEDPPESPGRLRRLVGQVPQWAAHGEEPPFVSVLSAHPNSRRPGPSGGQPGGRRAPKEGLSAEAP